MKDRTLALAGVFQSAELVHQAANHGTWSGYAADTCLGALFNLNPDSVTEVYGGKNQVRLGLETLLAFFDGDSDHLEAFRISMSLLQLEKPFRSETAMQALIAERLATIQAFAHPQQTDQQHFDLQASELGELYQQTISTLQPRVVINGRPEYLKNPRIVDWIRTLLFSGLRSAVLWQQLGGSRLNLLFGRRKLIQAAHKLLTA